MHLIGRDIHHQYTEHIHVRSVALLTCRFIQQWHEEDLMFMVLIEVSLGAENIADRDTILCFSSV